METLTLGLSGLCAGSSQQSSLQLTWQLCSRLGRRCKRTITACMPCRQALYQLQSVESLSVLSLMQDNSQLTGRGVPDPARSAPGSTAAGWCAAASALPGAARPARGPLQAPR